MKIDLTGQRFGRLVVLSFAETKKSATHWLCKCDCGASSFPTTSSLRRGNTSSCGCAGREQLKIRKTTHGMRGTHTYKVWLLMKGRCDRSGGDDYLNYKGRGITYDPRWKNFESFYADMGVAPPERELDRKDNDGNYCKENCRWATRRENTNNRRNSFLVEFNGERTPISVLAEQAGIHRCTLARRIKAGWTVDDAMAIPVLARRGGRPTSGQTVTK